MRISAWCLEEVPFVFLPCAAMSANLDPANVLDVLREAEFLPTHWRPLGSRLNVSHVDLSNIEADHSREGVQRCLEEVVDNWRRNEDVTWEVLAEAVANCREGGGRNVARKIREKVGLDNNGEAQAHNLPHQESGDSAIESSEGRQSITSSLSPLLSPMGSLTATQLAPGELLSEEEVKRFANWLNETFNEMVDHVQNALDDSGATPKRIVNIIHRHDENFSYVSGGFFDALRTAAEITDLFFELDKYWNYLNYFLLERLLLRPATKRLFASHLIPVYDDLHEKMLHYKAEMEYFRKHTDVEVYCTVVIKHMPKHQEIPPGFKELVHEKDLRTLEDVEKFRQELAYEYKLVDCLVFLKRIVCGCVILTFWIPKRAAVSGIALWSGDNEGSSVDPIIIRDGAQVEWSPLSHEDTVGETPQEETETEKEKAVVKKRSVAGSVISTVSKYLVPKYVLDPIVLMSAVSNGHKDEVKSLLSKGADPNASPPMIEFTPLMEASRIGNVEIARLLLDRADPNLTNNEGWTALMAAANNGRYGTVDILLERGAMPDMQDHSGWSALMAAVYKRHKDVALRIIQAGAAPHLQDKNHTNAMLLAIATNEQEEVVDALLESVETPAQLECQDSCGETVLIFACKRKNRALVSRLLSMKANPNICNNHGETPVLIATGLGEKEIVQELLENDANPNMGPEAPLMVALNMGHKEIADLLTNHGANHDQQDERGVRPFEMAELRNFTDLVQKLNPEQFTSRTPSDVLKLTVKSLSSVQGHLKLGPLFLTTEKRKGLPLVGLLQGLLRRFQVQ